jgi:folate-dependent phosphoribosylglycinamide formyltransferase PurN
LLYVGLPLGAEVLRRAGFVPHIACFGHRMLGLRRARTELARHVLPRRTSEHGDDLGIATERPLVLFKPDLADPSIVRTLASARPDAILSWFWPQRIPETVLALAPRGAFGVHPSLLPRHRGPDPYFHAIRAGDAESGVTLHRLDADYDTGRVVAQRRVAIADTDDAWRLARKLDRPSLALLVECAERLSRGEALEGEVQDESRATEAPQPTEENLCIDWDAPAAAGKFDVLTRPYTGFHGMVFAEESTVAPFLLRARREGLRDFGACMSPHTAFLLLQGLETLPLRMARHVDNARKVVAFLAGHPQVASVAYPELPGHPDHALARRLLPRGCGAVLSFNLNGSRTAGKAFVEALTVFSHLANVGDAKSLVIHPASTTHFRVPNADLAAAGITEGTIRLSVGLEDAQDLIDDLARALKIAARVT